MRQRLTRTRVYVGSTNWWQQRSWRQIARLLAQGDRLDNEHDYLQKALKILENVKREEESGDGYEVVAAER